MIEKGSIQEAMMNLQNLGLTMNERMQQGKLVTNQDYQNLLDYCVNVLRGVDTYTNEIEEMFTAMEAVLKK